MGHVRSTGVCAPVPDAWVSFLPFGSVVGRIHNWLALAAAHLFYLTVLVHVVSCRVEEDEFVDSFAKVEQIIKNYDQLVLPP